jgi:hypothetical protein
MIVVISAGSLAYNFRSYKFVSVANKVHMTKNRIVSLILFSCLAFQAPVKAQDYKTALGIRISSQDAAVNNSISFKQFFSPAFAVEGLFSFGDPVALGFLLEKHHPITANNFSWFWGAGPYFGFAGDRKFGVHGAAGLDLKFPSLPFNLSVDWKPELNITRIFSFEPAAVGLSARFVFR